MSLPMLMHWPTSVTRGKFFQASLLSALLARRALTVVAWAFAVAAVLGAEGDGDAEGDDGPEGEVEAEGEDGTECEGVFNGTLAGVPLLLRE
jgi:hypothetical protein